MKLLWLGLGGALAYVLLSKKGNGPATVLTPSPVPGLAPAKTCAEWEAYGKSCNELAAMGASCEAWVGPVPQGCPPPTAAKVSPITTATNPVCPPGSYFDRTNGCMPTSGASAFPALTFVPGYKGPVSAECTRWRAYQAAAARGEPIEVWPGQIPTCPVTDDHYQQNWID